MLKPSLTVLLFLGFFHFTRSQDLGKPINESMQSETLRLKSFAFCLCLREAMADSAFWVNEGSAAAYFERSEADFEVIGPIQELITEKLKENYVSKNSLDLSVMKCLDLYNSRQLDSLISK